MHKQYPVHWEFVHVRKTHDDVIKWEHFRRYWTGEFPAQMPVTQSFDVFFNLRLNRRLHKQSLGWWFETPSHPLWCHCNVLARAIMSELRETTLVVTFGCDMICDWNKKTEHCGTEWTLKGKVSMFIWTILGTVLWLHMSLYRQNTNRLERIYLREYDKTPPSLDWGLNHMNTKSAWPYGVYCIAELAMLWFVTY